MGKRDVTRFGFKMSFAWVLFVPYCASRVNSIAFDWHQQTISNAAHVTLHICCLCIESSHTHHNDIIKWKHFPRHRPFMRGNHRSLVNSPHKGQWRGALLFSLICAWINGWVHNQEAGDLRRHRAHYDVTVMHENQGTVSNRPGALKPKSS